MLHSQQLFMSAHIHRTHQHNDVTTGAHAIRNDRLHTIAALLSVCVQHDDGQIHETHETTRTHRMVSAMVLFVFAWPQDIHTKKNKRETNQRACPPGPLRFRTQKRIEIFMVGDT